MKSIIICIAFVMAPLFTAEVQPGNILAMGSKSGAGHSQDIKTDERHLERDHEGKGTGEGLSSKESGTQKKEKAPPAKRPRLKYRDESKCSC
jgi:hypothetical protein